MPSLVNSSPGVMGGQGHSPTPSVRSLEDLSSMMESMHGIVNLDAVSALLQGLLQHISRQSVFMNELQEQVHQMVPRREHEEHVHRLEVKIQQLEETLIQTKKAATAYLLDQEYTAGELATSNYYQLQKLSRQVAACITRTEVEKQYQELMLIHDENVRIQQDLNRIHQILNELNVAQAQLYETVAEQEARIALKLDRSELPYLQALANKIITYDEFKVDTTKRLEVLETDSKTMQGQISQHSQDIHRIDHVIEDTIIFNMNKLALKKDVHVLAKELKIHQEILDRVAFQSSIEELRTSLTKTLQVIEQTQYRIESTKIDLSDLKNVVSTKAAQVEVDLCLKKKDFQIAITATNQEIQTKTDLPYSEAMQEHLQVLEQRLLEESERVALALRFIDWFTTRGENYEHNLKIIDRHLKDLVTSDKTPRVHTYYLPGNRVQFNTATSNHDPNVIPIGEPPLSSERVLKALHGPDVLQLGGQQQGTPTRTGTRQVTPFSSPSS